ncbi:MAG: alpha/beta hydrolase [Candidatus Izemoplasmatales bacterium]|nr:alpha/beta hydrolase [Candidatus Izemoplasmatales bacterium]
MEPWIWIVIAIVLILLIFVGLVSFKLAYALYHPIRYDENATRETENERSPGLMALYDGWQKNNYFLTTRNGYDIHVIELMENTSSNQFVVIAHGYTYTHHGALKYAKMFLELGFRVVMFDERFHGKSGGDNCTLGGKEQFDLEDVITNVFQRYGNDIHVATFGESMGAVTALLEQTHDDRLEFVGADCGFSDLTLMSSQQLQKKLHLPPWPFVPLGGWIFSLVTGVRFEEVSPIEAVKKAKVPLFFAHGEADRFVRPMHSERMAAAATVPHTLFIGKNGAKHAMSARVDEEHYFQALSTFLKEHTNWLGGTTDETK